MDPNKVIDTINLDERTKTVLRDALTDPDLAPFALLLLLENLGLMWVEGKSL